MRAETSTAHEAKGAGHDRSSQLNSSGLRFKSLRKLTGWSPLSVNGLDLFRPTGLYSTRIQASTSSGRNCRDTRCWASWSRVVSVR